MIETEPTAMPTDMSFEQKEFFLASRFNRAILYDVCLSEYFIHLNDGEKPLNDKDWVDALEFTSSLIRHGTYAAFADILDFGSPALLKQSIGVLESSRKYLNHEIEAVAAEGSPSDALGDIMHFINDFRAGRYGKDYLGIKETG